MSPHRFLAQFCFPQRATGSVLDVCVREAGGCTYWPAQGVWRSPTGHPLIEPMYVGVASVAAETALERLRERVLVVLAELGEVAGWFVVLPVDDGGVYALARAGAQEAPGSVAPSDTPSVDADEAA